MSAQPQMDSNKKRLEGLRNLVKVLFGSDDNEIKDNTIQDFASKEDSQLLAELENSNKKITSMENDFKNRLTTSTPKRVNIDSQKNIESIKNTPIDQIKKETTKKSEEIEHEL